MIKELPRINELAKIAKERALTQAELKERDILRKKYLEAVRGATNNMLLSSKIMDREGNDMTPEKLKEVQNRLRETRC